jgi:two-component system nitrogen regulation response regulator GlnG
MSRLMAKRSFSGVIMETKRDRPNDLAEIQRLIDPKETFLLAGSSSALRDAPQVVSTLARTNGHVQKAPPLTFRLDDYLESKIGDFVRAMREGSARNLHATLIKAVERPLLVRVLRETNGNQIQAAELLGMNRNTLRKKLKEFKIPVMRERS